MFEKESELTMIGTIAWIMLTDKPTIKKAEAQFDSTCPIFEHIQELSDAGRLQITDTGSLRLLYRFGKKDIEGPLATFSVFYDKYPGRKAGLETSFAALKKKNKDWEDVLPLLNQAVEEQRDWWSLGVRAKRAGHDIFIPPWRNLATWINQRGWEDVLPALPDVGPEMEEDALYEAYMKKVKANSASQHLIGYLGTLLTPDQVREWTYFRGPFIGITSYASDSRLHEMFWASHSEAGRQPGSVYRILVAKARKIIP
jgi:hypothetical protein